jgi:hypothetical protein
MARPIGKVVIDLDLDPDRYNKAQKKILAESKTGAKVMENNFKNLGIKSGAMYDLMRKQAEASYQKIRQSGKFSADEMIRVEQAKAARIKRINEEQFGAQTSMLDKMKKNWMAYAAAATAAYMALSKAIGSVNRMVSSANEAFVDYERQSKRIENQIRITGRAGEVTGAQFEAMAQRIDKATMAGADQVRSAQAMLLAFKSIETKDFERILTVAADMAEVMETNVTGAARQMAMAFERGNEGLTMLRRSGVVFAKEQEDVIRKLYDTNQVAKAQDEILRALEGRYGGTAAAAASGLAGELDNLARVQKNFNVAMGEAISPAYLAFIRTKTQLYQGLAEVLELMQSPQLRELERIDRQISGLAARRESIEGQRFAGGLRGALDSKINDLLEQRAILLREINKERSKEEATGGSGNVVFGGKSPEEVQAETDAVYKELLKHQQLANASQKKLDGMIHKDRIESELARARLRQQLVNDDFDFRKKLRLAELDEEKKAIQEISDIFDKNRQTNLDKDIDANQKLWDTAIENIQSTFASALNDVFTGAARDFESIFKSVVGSITNVFAQQFSAKLTQGLTGGGFDIAGMAGNLGAGLAIGFAGQMVTKIGEESKYTAALRENTQMLEKNNERLRQLLSDEAASPFESDITEAARLFNEIMSASAEKVEGHNRAMRLMLGRPLHAAERIDDPEHFIGDAAELFSESMQLLTEVVTRDIETFYDSIMEPKTDREREIETATRRFAEFRDGIARLAAETGEDFSFLLNEWNKKEQDLIAEINERYIRAEREGIISRIAAMRQSMFGGEETLDSLMKKAVTLWEQFTSESDPMRQLDLLGQQYTVMQQIRDIQARTLEETIRNVKSLDNLIMELTGGSLAAVQSEAWFRNTYESLLGRARETGTAEDIDALNTFVRQYASFMQDFGGNYQQFTSGIVEDLREVQEIISGGATLDDLNQKLADLNAGIIEGIPMQITDIQTALDSILDAITGQTGATYIPQDEVADAAVRRPSSWNRMMENTRNMLNDAREQAGDTVVHVDVDGQTIATAVARASRAGNDDLNGQIRKVARN